MMQLVGRTTSRTSVGPLVLAGFAAGVMVGALAWRRQQDSAHDQLFSASTVHSLGASPDAPPAR